MDSARCSTAQHSTAQMNLTLTLNLTLKLDKNLKTEIKYDGQ